jgi:hypothetical protein
LGGAEIFRQSFIESSYPSYAKNQEKVLYKVRKNSYLEIFPDYIQGPANLF